MCMYYDDKILSSEDIYSYIVFKKKKLNFLNIRRTIRRNYRYRPKPDKTIKIPVIYVDFRRQIVFKGLFSYRWWCPINDKECEVWLCKIPRGSIIYSNSWEFVSDRLQFIKKLQ